MILALPAVGKDPFLVVYPAQMRLSHATHSLRYGRLNRASIIVSIGVPRCNTPSTAAVIGISTSRRAASRATAAAVATPSTTERRPASAAARLAPRPSAAPSVQLRDCPAV